ncbi:MAG: PAS domain S-box protein [Desulfurivibrionaceae bacterium]
MKTYEKKHPNQGGAIPDAALLSYALDHVREAVFLMSDTGQFVYVNREACRRLGYTANELLALTVFDIDPVITPPLWHERLQTRKRSRAGVILETSHRAKDGRTYPVEVFSSYFEYNTRGYTLSLAHDISERKEKEAQLRQREQEFRTLADNSPDNIARYDREGQVLYCNQNLASHLDLNPDEIKGLSHPDLHPNGEYADYYAMLMRCMETNSTLEMELHIPDTADEVHLIRFTPEYDEAGQVIGVLAIGRNITDYKRSQRKLWQQETELTANKNALTVLFDHSRHAEDEIRENMQASLEQLIIPCLDLLENCVAGNPAAQAALQLTRESVQRVTLPLVKKLTSASIGLSARELQIAHMIARGRPTKEIAPSLNLALGTVEFYRDRIRRKLGIKNKKTNLRTYLLNFDR